MKERQEHRKTDKGTGGPGRKYSSRRRRYLANGSYSIAVTAIAVAVIVLVNVIVSEIPGKFTSFDLSDQKLFSIGEISRGVLDSLTDTVTLDFVTETGQEDEAVCKLLEAYADASERIRLETIDAVANPSFLNKYSEEPIPLNSVVAVCGERSKIASYYDFYRYDSYYSAPSYWDAEGRITSAIASVAFGKPAKVCYSVGHDELEISAEMSEAMDKADLEAVPLNLLAEEIPSDASALIIYAPAQDFTEDEVRKVLHYLEGGGKLLLMTMPEEVSGAATPVLDSIMKGYGVTRKGGLLLEGDSSHYVQAPYLLLPNTAASEVTSGLSNQNIIAALPEALEVGDTDEAVYTVTNLLTSSEKAYIKKDIADTVEKADEDESGQYVIAVAVEETLSMDSMGSPDVDLDPEEPEGDTSAGEEERAPSAARILYFSTPCLFSSAALSTLIQQQTALPEGNTALFSKAMAYLTEQKTAVSVEAKSLGVPQTLISGRAQILLGTGVMIALPAAVLVLGFYIFRRRRRR